MAGELDTFIQSCLHTLPTYGSSANKLPRLLRFRLCRLRPINSDHSPNPPVIFIQMRRFPPPWSVERIPGGYKVLDA